MLHYELDGAFVKLPSITDNNIVGELELEENLVIVARPEYKDIRSIISRPFLMSSTGCPNRTQLESWLKFQGVGKVRFMEFNHTDSIIQGVLADLGVSFIPHSVIKDYEDQGLLTSYAIPSEFSSTKTYFIRHKDSLKTNALAKFIENVLAATSYHPPRPEVTDWSTAAVR